MRFGLLNLLIAVVFLGGLLGCWILRKPWAEWKKIPGKGTPIEDVAISREHQYLVTREDQTEIKLYSFPELKLLWTGPGASWLGLPNFHVSFYGDPTSAVHVFLVNFQTGAQQHEYFDLKSGDYLKNGEWGTDQARASTLRKSSPEAFHQSVFTVKGETFTFTPDLSYPWEEYAELEDDSDGKRQVFN